MGNRRPVVSLVPTTFDVVALVATGFVILYAIIYVILGYDSLPDSIPTHFGASGQADAYGAKSTLLILLTLEVGMAVMLFIASRYPHKHNYLIKITEENAARVYGLSVSMLHAINCWVSAYFTYLIVMTMRIANQQSDSLSTFALIVFIGGLTILVVYFLLKSNQSKSLPTVT